MNRADVLAFWKNTVKPDKRRQNKIDAVAKAFCVRFIGVGNNSEVREQGARELALTMDIVGVRRDVVEAVLYKVLVKG